MSGDRGEGMGQSQGQGQLGSVGVRVGVCISERKGVWVCQGSGGVLESEQVVGLLGSEYVAGIC